MKAKISELEHKLKNAQCKMGRVTMHLAMHEEVGATSIELEKWLNIEERALQQKARINWLNLWDSNTTFVMLALEVV